MYVKAKLIEYGSLSYRKTHQNMPANILAPAIPAVAEEAKPAKSNAIAKIVPLVGPMRGRNNSSACSSLCYFNAVSKEHCFAANKIMAELIIHPIPP